MSSSHVMVIMIVLIVSITSLMKARYRARHRLPDDTGEPTFSK